MTSRRWIGLVGMLLIGAPAGAERRAVTVYTTTDGLPRDQINSILVDSHGFLWFGTEEGLARFDGTRFATFGPADGLRHTAIRGLLEDRDGTYWLATTRGLYWFTPGARRFQLIPPRRDAMDGAPTHVTVNALAQDASGVLWCGTARGLARVARAADDPPDTEARTGAMAAATGTHLVLEPVSIGLPDTEEHGVVRTLVVDRRGALWIGSGSGLYRRTNDGHVDRLTTADGLPDREVWALARAGDEDALWVGTRLGLGIVDLSAAAGHPRVRRVHVTPGESGESRTASTPPLVNVRSLHAAPWGDVWIGLATGVVRLTTIDRAARTYRAERMLDDVFARDLTTDAAGNLWVGSDVGAQRLAAGGLVTYGEGDGLLTTEALALFQDAAGRVCATTAADRYAIQCFDGRRFSATLVGVPRDRVDGFWGRALPLVAPARAGDWWVPAADGLYRFPAGPVESLAHATPTEILTSRRGLTGDRIFNLFEDSRGDLWIATYADRANADAGFGLCRWVRASGRLRRYGPTEGLPEPMGAAFAFAEDREGAVWIGFEQGQVARCGADRCAQVLRRQELIGSHWRDMRFDRQGRLWLASSSDGVGRIDDPTASAPRVTRLTQAEGLSSQTVWAITEDAAGRLYFAGGLGVDRLDPASGAITRYTEADGLARGEVHAALRARDNTLWFAARGGLSRLTPHDASIPPLAPVRITAVRVAGASRPLSAVGEPAIEHVRLGADDRSLEIAFVSPWLGPGRRPQYQYRLDGLDTDWQPPTRDQSIIYARLAAGAYRFTVRARTEDGRSHSAPAFVGFTVASPIWQRWWFLALAAAAAAALLIAFHRARVARSVAVERVRTNIAADLHDDIGGTLVQIAVLSEVVQRQVPESHADLRQPLTQMADAARSAVSSMSDIVWAINPRRDSLRDMTRRMRRLTNDLLPPRGIRPRFEAADVDLPVSAELRRQVYLIFKEALNNLACHAHGTQATIVLRVEQRRLTLDVSDDGCGFDLAAACDQRTHDGHGLITMRERAAAVGGTLDVRSRVGEGTTVRLRVPLA